MFWIWNGRRTQSQTKTQEKAAYYVVFKYKRRIHDLNHAC